MIFFFSRCFSFVAGPIGKKGALRCSLAQAPYEGAFCAGSVRVREPRPETMRKGVDQLKPGG